MKKICSFLLSILLFASMVITAQAVSAVPTPVMDATESVVRILSEYADGYASGSGFVIKSDKSETLIATNYHVVEGKPYSISIWISEEETISATILASTNQKDMCILKLSYPVSLKPLTLAENSANQGDAVYAVGFPSVADYLSDKEAHTSADATITDGIVSAVREMTMSSYGAPTKMLQINAAINSGNSGGPLFNTSGKVVGINTYGLNDSQGIFGAIDVSELMAFMADYGITVTASAKSFQWTYFVIAVAVICVVIILIMTMRKKRTKTALKEVGQTISLREYMQSYPNGIGIHNAVSMLLPVALYLRDIHNNGCVHLQVSPDSIFVGSNGVTLAEATTAETDRYTSGYAAPEIYRGVPAGNRSDIYSFCAVLFYVISGNQPMNSLSRTGSDEITFEDVTFTQFLKTGMALDSASRYATMQNVIINLSQYNMRSFQYAVTTQEEKTVAEAEKKCPSLKKIAILIMLVLVILPIGSYFGCYLGARINAQNEKFSVAEKLLILPGVTALHDENLVAYVNAGCLLDAREYSNASTAFLHLSGYMNADGLELESRYRLALQKADKGEFASAISTLENLKSAGYGNAAEKIIEVQYRWAWALIDGENYMGALQKLDLIQDHFDVDKALAVATELAYEEGQSLYYKGDFIEAQRRFRAVSPYGDSQKYLTLIDAQNFTWWSHDAVKAEKALTDIFYFEDAAELLLSRQELAKAFLQGSWRGDGYYFTMDKDGGVHYNLPWFNYGDYYYIEQGVLRLCSSNSQEEKSLFAFTALTPDCIEVFCYKNNQSFTLYRQ